MPTMEGAGHLSPRDDAVSEEGPLMRADPVQDADDAFVMKDSELTPSALKRLSCPIRR